MKDKPIKKAKSAKKSSSPKAAKSAPKHTIKKSTPRATSKTTLPIAPMPPVNTFPVQPLHDRVLIKEITETAEKTTSFGLILPASASEDKSSKRGIIIATGPGRYEDGAYSPVAVSVGDKVIFQWGDKVTHDGTDYYIVRESEIVAIIK
jgi:chaperonin GroES